PISLRLSI
ncbi:hypothetical protein D030_3511B, partial [Vibrio parahaemolyticus AQ3810]